MVYEGIRLIIIKIDKRKANTTVKVELMWSVLGFLKVGPAEKRRKITKAVQNTVLRALERLNNDPVLIERITRTPPIDTSPVVENLKNGKRYIFTFVNGSEPFRKLLTGAKANGSYIA